MIKLEFCILAEDGLEKRLDEIGHDRLVDIVQNIDKEMNSTFKDKINDEEFWLIVRPDNIALRIEYIDTYANVYVREV